MKTISTEQLHNKYESDNSTQLIDVRGPGEFQAAHIPFAKNVPMGQIGKETLADIADGKRTIYLVCQSGMRSAMACKKLHKLGFENVANVEGGTAAWARAGFPVDGNGSTGPVFSIFTPTGMLIAAGIALTLTVNWYFILLPALVGVYMMISAKKEK